MSDTFLLLILYILFYISHSYLSDTIKDSAYLSYIIISILNCINTFQPYFEFIWILFYCYSNLNNPSPVVSVYDRSPFGQDLGNAKKTAVCGGKSLPTPHFMTVFRGGLAITVIVYQISVAFTRCMDRHDTWGSIYPSPGMRHLVAICCMGTS